jgi:hypothetical protein
VYASAADPVFPFGAARKLREIAHLWLAVPDARLFGSGGEAGNCIGGAGAARDGGDEHKDRRLLTDPLKEMGFGVLAQ